MTRLTGNIHGTDKTLIQTPAHYLLSALDNFLVAEYPDKVLGATVQLSIGVETFIKSKLENLDPTFIHHKIGWKKIRRSLRKATPADKISLLQAEFTDAFQSTNGSTIDFARAIEVFHLVRPQPLSALKDLKRLREYRNGLFHWKAEHTNTFELSKLCLRIFLWIYEVVKAEHDGHLLSGEVLTMDPMTGKYQKLLELKGLADQGKEQSFNFERRVMNYHQRYTIVHQSQARLRGDVFIPNVIIWNHACPACGYPRMQMFEIGLIRDGVRENRDVVANCVRCDFSATGKEQEHMIPAGMPTLIEIFDKLKRDSESE